MVLITADLMPIYGLNMITWPRVLPVVSSPDLLLPHLQFTPKELLIAGRPEQLGVRSEQLGVGPIVIKTCGYREVLDSWESRDGSGN